ncbi:CD1375 family protein [Secundilactobacillus yichangensis]|uniref:CD1375 family protein n=1 Tax=Secundilactobacillus yichangensis TaxID=2799580 RepID=UPI001940C8CA|nr:CD1375 family protein [Secundilactobacillus yichangensis]
MTLNKKFSALTMLYAANVLDGGRTLDEVPEVLRDDVAGILKNDDSADSTTASTTPAA